MLFGVVWNLVILLVGVCLDLIYGFGVSYLVLFGIGLLLFGVCWWL